MSTIKQDTLKDMGFYVQVVHRRYCEGTCVEGPWDERALRKHDGSLASVDPKGGQTEVYLVRDGVEFQGIANCSRLDNFNRKVGFQIAAGRALKRARAAEGAAAILKCAIPANGQ